VARNDLSKLLSGAGGGRHRSQVLQVLSFPGLSVDNAPSIPSATSAGSPGGVDQQAASLSQQLSDLKTVQRNQLDQLTQNTQALLQNTSSRGSSSSTSGDAASSILSTVLSATGISPLITGLLSLLGGGSSQPAVQPLTPFSLPASIQYAGVVQNGAITAADYGQNGQLRPLASPGATSAPASVQIQVNALDSQSFIDHSDDIAAAVRHALLNSNSLNDVIASL